MDEALLKRNTDCVYFLASPLTCKKGADCEFRHSNIARLNPKECWYWLAGNCRNPNCAFRHPPLDGNGGAPSQSAPGSVTESKTNVPCYFYFNGYCNKGDRCSYLHDIDGNESTGKSLKAASAGDEALAHPSENKESSGNVTMSTPRNPHTNQSETASMAPVDAKFQPKEDLNYFEQSALRDVSLQRQQLIQVSNPKRNLISENVPQQSVSPHISVSSDEEASEIRSDSHQVDGGIHRKSRSFTDQSSEEQDDVLVQDERCDSSPGFDVLVDGKSENLGCDDDHEYFLTIDREQRELNSRLFGYDFENREYVPDDEFPPERGIAYESFYRPDRRQFFGIDRRIPVCATERMSDSILSRKRNPMPMELAVDDQDFLDLRDRLRRRRVTDSHSITGLSRRHESVRSFGRSRERPQRHGMGVRLHERLASEVGNSSYELLSVNCDFYNGGIQRGSLRHSQQYRSRKQHHKERRLTPPRQQFPSSGVSRKPVPRETTKKPSSAQVSTAFTGPKTLAQIKEEKGKAEEIGGPIGIPRHAKRSIVDFQGPKPLNEILKEKGKIADKKSEDSAGSASN